MGPRPRGADRVVRVDQGKRRAGSSAIAPTSSRMPRKSATLYWQRYQFTMDTNWLRDRAYPIIKGAAEFYRNFPNFGKEADGKYHIHHVNNGEVELEFLRLPQ